MEDFEVTDPSDWPVAEWESIDTALRCPICKEFFVTAMMLTGCSHNFCSLCVRQALQQEKTSSKTCPTCRAPASDAAAALKPNRALDELVRLFSKVRSRTIEALSGTSAANTEHMVTEVEVVTPQKKRTLVAKDKTPVMETRGREVEPLPAQTSNQPYAAPKRSQRTASSEKETLKCPICNAEMKCSNAKFNQHIDSCLSGFPVEIDQDEIDDGSDYEAVLTEPQKKPAPNPPTVSTRSTRQTSASTSASTSERQPRKPAVKSISQRMSKQWYSGMKDSKLRSLLQEHGLPTYGGRKMLEKRHAQFVLMWNAVCDNPDDVRTKKDLIRELQEWETLQMQPPSRLSALGKPSPQEDEKHVRKYQSEFDQLIAMARPKKKAKEEEKEDAAAESEVAPILEEAPVEHELDENQPPDGHSTGETKVADIVSEEDQLHSEHTAEYTAATCPQQ